MHFFLFCEVIFQLLLVQQLVKTFILSHISQIKLYHPIASIHRWVSPSTQGQNQILSLKLFHVLLSWPSPKGHEHLLQSLWSIFWFPESIHYTYIAWESTEIQVSVPSTMIQVVMPLHFFYLRSSDPNFSSCSNPSASFGVSITSTLHSILNSFFEGSFYPLAKLKHDCTEDTASLAPLEWRPFSFMLHTTQVFFLFLVVTWKPFLLLLP